MNSDQAESVREFVEVAQKVSCKDVSHLESFFQDIIDQGGEGIILRDPNAVLQPGRSQGFLKHKVINIFPFLKRILLMLRMKKFRDAEARVVAAVGMNQWQCEL